MQNFIFKTLTKNLLLIIFRKSKCQLAVSNTFFILFFLKTEVTKLLPGLYNHITNTFQIEIKI